LCDYDAQVRECLRMNPVQFVRTALQYVVMRNHDDDRTAFRHDVMVFAHDDDADKVHRRFDDALRPSRRVSTRDDVPFGHSEVNAMARCVRECRWLVPVLTANFLADSFCVYFVTSVQFDRPHALVPVVWDQPLPVDIADVAVAELLRTGDPLYWPGDQAPTNDQRAFWESLLERTTPL